MSSDSPEPVLNITRQAQECAGTGEPGFKAIRIAALSRLHEPLPSQAPRSVCDDNGLTMTYPLVSLPLTSSALHTRGVINICQLVGFSKLRRFLIIYKGL